MRARRVVVLSAAVGGLVVGSLAGCTTADAPDARAARDAGSAGGHLREGVRYAADRVLDIHAPSPPAAPDAAAVPVVVLLHGCCGDRSDLGKLAESLAAAQLVVLNADWAGLDADATFPGAYEDVACAVRFAHQHARELGGDPDRVVVAGWSDGAMAAAAVAAAPGGFEGAGCLADPAGDGPVPAAVVGIAGFYGWSVPVDDRYVTPRAARLFGGGPEQSAEHWRTATPYSRLSTAPPTLLLVGTTDPLLDDAERYADALRRAGRPVRLVAVPPDGDQTLISPRTSEGRRVVAQIAAVAAAPTELAPGEDR